jgi:hypothetical protein
MFGKEAASVLPLLKQSKQIVFKKEGVIMLQCNGYVKGLQYQDEENPQPEDTSVKHGIIIGIHAEKRSCYALIGKEIFSETLTYCEDSSFNIPLILYDELDRYLTFLAEIENSVG